MSCAPAQWNCTLTLVGALFIALLSELCVLRYVHHRFNAEIQSAYLPHHAIEEVVLRSLRSEQGFEEVAHLVGEILKDIDDDAGSTRSRRSVEFKMDGAAGQEATNSVWFAKHASVAMSKLETYCADVASGCPAGPRGLPGASGDAGSVGERGVPGSVGPRGAVGPPGRYGQKGERGAEGTPGHAGRPGAAGLNGRAGRNGKDAKPGIHGRDGDVGKPGSDGRNATDGAHGERGARGPQGSIGHRGITGPRGRSGRPGAHGVQGAPGLHAMRKSNAVRNSTLLVPPRIIDARPEAIRSVIPEGDNVTLSCASFGAPLPQVLWIRADGQPIVMGAWQSLSVTGRSLNITTISRVHMGTYQCLADNGVPPYANQSFVLEVHFVPLVRLWRAHVGAPVGATRTLECEVEAFPEPLRYWEREDGRPLENDARFGVHDVRRDAYTVRMRLVVLRVQRGDYMHYDCVAKNERGKTRGRVRLYQMNIDASVPSLAHDAPIEIGQRAPKRVAHASICPPPPQCAICPKAADANCARSGVSLFDLIGKWRIRQFSNASYPGTSPRKSDCVLYAVGKPIFVRHTNRSSGSWMQDALDARADRYYATQDDDSSRLYEYENRTLFRDDAPSKIYRLRYAFDGGAHVVHNGSFYYHERGAPKIVQLRLATESVARVDVPLTMSADARLYATGRNYMDLDADENGVWVVFGVPDSNNTAVMKIDPDSLHIEYVWNVSLNHRKVGEMFVACGVLYAVDGVVERQSRVRFALDLYTNTLLDVSLPFTNPFRNTTMVAYDSRRKELHTCDNGNQLTYPVRCHERRQEIGRDVLADVVESVDAAEIATEEANSDEDNVATVSE